MWEALIKNMGCTHNYFEYEVPIHYCYAQTGHSPQREVSLSGVGSGLSALATCDADMW